MSRQLRLSQSTRYLELNAHLTHFPFRWEQQKKGVAPATSSGETHCVFPNPVISQVARICFGAAANVSSRIRPISQYDDGCAAVRGASHSR